MRTRSPRMAPPRERRRRVDGEHGHGVTRRPQRADQAAGERRLARTRRAGDADGVGRGRRVGRPARPPGGRRRRHARPARSAGPARPARRRGPHQEIVGACDRRARRRDYDGAGDRLRHGPRALRGSVMPSATTTITTPRTAIVRAAPMRLDEEPGRDRAQRDGAPRQHPHGAHDPALEVVGDECVANAADDDIEHGADDRAGTDHDAEQQRLVDASQHERDHGPYPRRRHHHDARSEPAPDRGGEDGADAARPRRRTRAWPRSTPVTRPAPRPG